MAHPNFTVDAQDGKMVHVSDPKWAAPQLGAALLDQATEPRFFPTKLDDEHTKKQKTLTLPDADFDGQLKELLEHIYSRVTGGLADPWLSRAGYDYPHDLTDATSRADVLAVTSFLNTPEEKWARALCEQFVFCTYHSPGLGYGTNSDINFLELSPSVTPIAVACQTLSTYGAMSRGIPLDDLSTRWVHKDGTTQQIGGCSCSGATVKYAAFDQGKNKTKKMKTEPTATDPAERNKELKELGDNGQNLGAPDWARVSELVKLGVTPGSVLVFNAGGFEYSKQDVVANRPNVANAHSATVLRISGNRIQFIDTGVSTGTGERSAEGGTVDHGFTENTVNSADSLVDVGVLRDCSSTLEDFAKKTAEARPLGLTRLVITRTGSRQVVFVSKLLPMRWPVSRLIWSLRHAPVDGVVVTWLVYLTHDKASSLALIGSTNASPSTFLPAKTTLKLANIITTAAATTDKTDIQVYRTHQLAEWRRNLEIRDTQAPTIEALQYKLDDGNRVAQGWADSPANFGNRYLRSTSSGKGTIDDKATGSPLVDP